MDIRTLRYFMAIVKEKSFTKASYSLNTTQPNLSRQIRELENEIGRSLFIREGKRISLTPTGELLRKRSEEILDLYEKTEKELIGNEEISGGINIGGAESIGMRLVARAASLMKKDYENVVFNLYSGDRWDVIERLEKGLLDYALMIGKDNDSSYESVELNIKDVWGVYIPREDKLSEKGRIECKDLIDKRILISRHALSEGIINPWLPKNAEPEYSISTYNLIYNASLMAKEGYGYLVGLEGLIKNDDEKLVFLPFAPRLESKLFLVWKKSHFLAESARLFLDYFRKANAL